MRLASEQHDRVAPRRNSGLTDYPGVTRLRTAHDAPDPSSSWLALHLANPKTCGRQAQCKRASFAFRTSMTRGAILSNARC